MKRFFSIIIISIFTLSTLLPSPIYAEEAVNTKDKINLYEVKNEIILEDSILINEGAYLYGIHNAETNQLSVQYGNRKVEINGDNVREVEELEADFPEYVELLVEEELQNIPEGEILYNEDDDSAIIEFISTLEYPIQDNNLFIIGNIALEYSSDKDPLDEDNGLSEDASLIEESSQNSDEITDTNEETVENDVVEEEEVSPVEEADLTESESESEEEVDSSNEQNSSSIFSVQLAEFNHGFSNSDQYFKTTMDSPVYGKVDGKLVVVGYLKKGEVYPRYESSPSWHLIQYGSEKYFVEKEGTEPASGDSLKNINSDLKVTNETVTATADMTIYDNTSGSLVPFGVIEKGQEYKITHDYGGAWIYIVFADRVGFVKSSELLRNYYPPFGDYFRVLEDDLPVYDRSTSTGKLVEVGTLKKGQIYPRYESSRNWHLIQYGKKKLYVTKDGTEPANGNTLKNINKKYSVTEQTVTATTDMTIYDNTSGSLVPFGMIKKGEEYAISHDYGGAWIYVVFADRVGFIKNAELLRNYYPPFGDYFRVLEENLPVYDNSTGKLIEIGTLKKGQIYPRYESSRNWHLIQFGDIKGFVKKNGTEPALGKDIENENNNEYKNQSTKIFSREDIIVYEQSSKGLVPFGTIKSGYTYNIAHDYGGKWMYVIFADRIGFVDSTLVEKHGYTYVDKTLEQALNLQMKVAPQTDHAGYIMAEYTEITGTVTGTSYIRSKPTTNSDEIGLLNKGSKVTIIERVKGQQVSTTDNWYKIDYEGKERYIYANLVNNIRAKVDGDIRLNVRSKSDVEDSLIYTILPPSKQVNVTDFISKSNGEIWLRVGGYGWVDAHNDIVNEYLDPENNDRYQHLDLSMNLELSAPQLNTFLENRLVNHPTSVLRGQGKTFQTAASTGKQINELYLISHALLETGYGTSNLATGKIEVGELESNKWVSFVPENGKIVAYTAEEIKNGNGTRWVIKKESNFDRNKARNIRKTYNMFGIGAVDSSPSVRGSIRAYREAWFSVESAINGGAKFIAEDYIHNQYGQNTLYKMRWNPTGIDKLGYATKQYATDIRWATKQVTNIKSMLTEVNRLDSPLLKFNFIQYKR